MKKNQKLKIKNLKKSEFNNDLLGAIKDFEDTHKEYLNNDGTVNDDGYNLLHDAEVNWADDIKWHDYEKYHLQPRLSDYWYKPSEDIEYKRHWIKLHPKKAEEYGVEVDY